MNAELAKELQGYRKALSNFVTRQNIPIGWLFYPDHIAVKAKDSTAFGQIVQSFQQESEQISMIEMDGRYLAAAKLAVKIALGFGHIEWVEIMEPKPEKVGIDLVGVEHMEFYYPYASTVQSNLEQRGVDYAIESNRSHAWISVPINNKGQELKLSDRKLADIVAEEILSGEAKLIKP